MKDVNILTNNGVNLQQSLELFGDMEMYDETLNDFLSMIDNKLASLENRKQLGDMANYAIEVHALKSDARYLGFTALADMSYESELKSKAGDIMFVQENHPKIIAEAKRMTAVAKQYLGMDPNQVVQNPNIVSSPAQSGAPVMQMPAPGVQMVVDANGQYVQQVMQQPMMQNPQMVQQPMMQPQMPAQPVTMPDGQVVMQPQPVVAPNGQVVVPQMVQQPAAAPTSNDIMDQAIMNQGPNGETVQFFPADKEQGNGTVQFFPTNDGEGKPQTPVYGNGQKEGIILIVDDSLLIVNFVKRIFEKRYDVMVATDGAAAIEIVDKDEIRKDIKACLLDLNMPNVNGFDVLEHFKQKGYFVRLPVAIESAAEDAESIERASSYPVVDILSKPFNERDIQRVIEKCLATYF